MFTIDLVIRLLAYQLFQDVEQKELPELSPVHNSSREFLKELFEVIFVVLHLNTNC